MTRSKRRSLIAATLCIAACGLEPPTSPAPAPSGSPSPQPAPDQPAPAPQPQPQQPQQPGAPTSPFPGYQLAWQDEFDGTSLDVQKWRSWDGPRRDGVSTADAITVSGGALHVRTYTEAGVHKTGFLGTDGRFEPTRGYFEARIRFSGAPGHWCAFWLLPPTIGNPRGDPAKAGVETDVAEHRVVDGGGWDLRDYVQVALNWDGQGAARRNVSKVTTLPGNAPVNGAWHVYAVLWTDSAYTFYVDGAQVWSTNAAVSARSEWLHLTCEVEDGGWAGSIPPAGYGTRDTSTTGMDVDWVRVWQEAP
ncbi:MAG TPA: glycoside hydrolase family 16 protein [Anaeromyxobacteraceae bacterium]|nr:glycoside hydrolase family 16 protein [Anaeromyxobacteraceae bacterium]